MTSLSGRIILLSGDFENGKTTLCLKLHSLLLDRELQAKGVICPPVFEDGIKSGINLMNAATGEQRPLAALRTGSTEGVFTKRWQFIKDSLEWGNEILFASVPCDVLFVDELGPLEFERGEGWQNGLKAVDSRAYLLALVVVRQELTRAALQRWQDAEILTIDRENQEIALKKLLAILKISQKR